MSAETLEHLADLVAATCGTRHVAVWSCAFGELDLRYGRLRQALVKAAHMVWEQARYELQEGRAVREDDATVLPLLSGRHDLVGLLALPVALPEKEITRRYLDDLLRSIAQHVLAPEPDAETEIVATPVDLLIEPGGLESLQRQAYATVMLRFGWNVSLVAAVLGIPRLTLARHLKAIGVVRPNPSSKDRRSPRAAVDGDMLGPLRALLWPRVEPRKKPA